MSSIPGFFAVELGALVAISSHCRSCCEQEEFLRGKTAPPFESERGKQRIGYLYKLLAMCEKAALAKNMSEKDAALDSLAAEKVHLASAHLTGHENTRGHVQSFNCQHLMVLLSMKKKLIIPLQSFLLMLYSTSKKRSI